MANYFESFIETQLRAHFQDQTKTDALNKKQETLLTQIKEIEQVNLKNVENVFEACGPSKSNFFVDFSKSFVSFCFVLEFKEDIRLIMTDGFLTENQLTCFKQLLMIISSPKESDIPESERKEAYSQLFEIDFSEVNSLFIGLFNCYSSKIN